MKSSATTGTATSGAEMHDRHLPPWWMLALRGVVAVLFGVAAVLWPEITLLWLAVLFAAFAIVAGAVSIAAAVTQRRTEQDWWLTLMLGLVGVGAGAIALLHPHLSALVLVLLIGAYMLMSGVLDIALAVQLRKTIRREWLLIMNGILAVVFGVLVFLFPAAGALALVWLISAYAIITGALFLTLAFRARGWTKGSTVPPGAVPPGNLAAGST